MNIYLKKIYFPTLFSEHNMLKLNKYNVFEWQDKHNITYTYHVNKPESIFINVNKNEIPTSIVSHVGNYDNSIKRIYIRLNSTISNCNNLNSLFAKLKKIKDRQVILDLSHVSMKNNIHLILDNLPQNIKISTYSENDYFDKEEEPMFPTDICWWALNLSEDEFIEFINHTTENTKNYLLKLRKVSLAFYTNIKEKYPRIDKMNSKEKADIVSNWCKENIKYDDRNSKLSLFEGIKEEKGNYMVKANIMKLLLNNYYMRVPCYIVKGSNIINNYHEWNSIYCNGSKLYYDLTYNKYGKQNTLNIISNDTDEKLSGTSWKPSHSISNNVQEYQEKKGI